MADQFAYQHTNIQQLCDSAHHKQQFAISKIQLKYDQQNYLNALNTKHSAFISKLALKNEQLTQFNIPNHQNSTAFEQWNTHTISSIRLLRYFISLHFLILILIFLTRFKLKKMIKIL